MQEAQRSYEKKIAAQNPNAHILRVNHTSKHEPWKAEALSSIFEEIVQRIFEDFRHDESDFVVRKTLLSHPSILSFQKDHPQLYYVLTNRTLMREEKYRSTLKNLLQLRCQVDRGKIPDDERADAAATEAIIRSLRPTEEP